MTNPSKGGTHRNVELDGLALLEAEVQFGALVWVLGLFCKLTLLFYPPGERKTKVRKTPAALPEHTDFTTTCYRSRTMLLLQQGGRAAQASDLGLTLK